MELPKNIIEMVDDIKRRTDARCSCSSYLPNLFKAIANYNKNTFGLYSKVKQNE